MDGFDASTAGRKGIAYDWRAAVRATEFGVVDEFDSWVTDEGIAALIDGVVAQ